MNPDLKDLRVAVVPTETGNGIDQSSTYEEIVACEETTYFSVPDYFKAQNDEELPLQHWSFLLDYNKKVDCTGMNTDGIDYDSKAQKIAYIKKVIKEFGETSCCDLELDHSPSLFSHGNTSNICELVEQFYADSVETILYHDDIELEYNNYAYDELPEDVLDEIYTIMEGYEAEQLKTEKRCED
jgi:hypothetical protein